MLGSLGYAAAIGLYAPLDALPEEWIRDGWRFLHFAGALPLLLLPRLARSLQETTRFAASEPSRIPMLALLRSHRRRVLGLGLLSFAAEVSMWPAFTLVSKHLREVLAYDSADVSLLILLGGLLGIAGNLVAGGARDRGVRTLPATRVCGPRARGSDSGRPRQLIWRSRSFQYGARSSRFRIFPGPDFGSSCDWKSTPLGTL
jgi:predicted MFS family arabinose efflux permease